MASVQKRSWGSCFTCMTGNGQQRWKLQGKRLVKDITKLCLLCSDQGVQAFLCCTSDNCPEKHLQDEHGMSPEGGLRARDAKLVAPGPASLLHYVTQPPSARARRYARTSSRRRADAARTT